MIIMLKNKINNIKEAVNTNVVGYDKDKNFYNAILDVLQDISDEIDEINELIQFSKNYNIY